MSQTLFIHGNKRDGSFAGGLTRPSVSHDDFIIHFYLHLKRSRISVKHSYTKWKLRGYGRKSTGRQFATRPSCHLRDTARSNLCIDADLIVPVLIFSKNYDIMIGVEHAAAYESPTRDNKLSVARNHETSGCPYCKTQKRFG